MSVLVVIHMRILGFEQRGEARGFRGLALGGEGDDGLHVGGGGIAPGAFEAVVAIGHQCHGGFALGGSMVAVPGGALGGDFLPRMVGDVDHHGLVSRLRGRFVHHQFQVIEARHAQLAAIGCLLGVQVGIVVCVHAAGTWRQAQGDGGQKIGFSSW